MLTFKFKSTHNCLVHYSCPIKLQNVKKKKKATNKLRISQENQIFQALGTNLTSIISEASVELAHGDPAADADPVVCMRFVA